MTRANANDQAVVASNTPASDTSSTPEASIARASIDAEIEKLQESIRTLKTSRNRLAPISKLPPELLARIFIHVTEPTVSISRSLKGIRNRYLAEELPRTSNLSWTELIQVTHICRLWRDIAFECPNYWSRPIFSCPENVLEGIIDRSKASSLSIRMHKDFSSSTKAHPVPSLARILTWERIEELHLTLPKLALSLVLELISGTSADSIRSLLLRDTAGVPGMLWHPSDTHTRYVLPAHILNTPMPHLQYLNITDCEIQWDALSSSLSQDLTTLRLCQVSTPSRSQFYDVLSRIPNLEDLSLTSALPVASTSDPARAVNLPNLQSCAIIGSPLSECLDFHKCVSYPTASAKLHFNPSDSDDADYAAVLSLISLCALPQRSHSNLFIELLDHPGSSRPIIALWDGPYEPAIENLHAFNIPDPKVFVDLTSIMIARAKYSSFLDFLSAPGLKLVCTSGGAAMLFGYTAWLTFFKRHQGIAALYLCGPEALPVFLALGTSAEKEMADTDKVEGDGPDVQLNKLTLNSGNPPPAEEDEDEDDDDEDDEDDEEDDFTTPCLPNLSVLTLEEHGEDVDLEVYDEEFLLLTDFLYKANRSGYKIQQLNLFACHRIDDEIVEQFSEDVGEVEWDGMCLPDDEDEDDEEDEGEHYCEHCGTHHAEDEDFIEAYGHGMFF